MELIWLQYDHPMISYELYSLSILTKNPKKIEQEFKNKLLQKIAAFSEKTLKTIEFKMLITLLLRLLFG